MAESSTQDCFDEKIEGYIGMREANFQCEDPDEHLGCDLGIDVYG
jgi:hypothetical protein